MSAPLNVSDIEIYRPYDDYFPASLLVEAGASDDCIDLWQAADLVRIAKFHNETVGMYAMDRSSQSQFFLYGMVVAKPYRRFGLGRWLVGHALGVAESKGGRQVFAPAVVGTRCFDHIGFHKDGDGLRFDVFPE